MKKLTTEQILSSEFIGRITDDEKIRFARDIESKLIRNNAKYPYNEEQDPLKKISKKIAIRLREIAEMLDSGKLSVTSFSHEPQLGEFGENGCAYSTARSVKETSTISALDGNVHITITEEK